MSGCVGGANAAPLQQAQVENEPTPDASCGTAAEAVAPPIQEACAQTSVSAESVQFEAATLESCLKGYEDATAGAAIDKLKGECGEISGDRLHEAVHDATKDRDAQAAGAEYNDLKGFADENWDKLSPDAKEKFRTYESFVNAARADGKTGIPQADYEKMLCAMKKAGYQDRSAGEAIETLKDSPGPISGEDMREAITSATEDRDASAAGTEFNDLKKFATENWDRMSPDARQAFRVYEDAAGKAQACGHTGIAADQYNQMLVDMKSAAYEDQSSASAIEVLKDQDGPISGDDMQRLVFEGTKDLDAQAAAGEFEDISGFAKESWGRMTPDAKDKFRIYEKYANQAQAAGNTGIPAGEWNKMIAEMKCTGYNDATAGAAIEALKSQNPGEISGDQLTDLVHDATKDLDAQAAGNEYADVKKYVTDNWDKLSPDAKEKFRVYEGAVKQAQANGMTGIPAGDYAAMLQEMKTAGYDDVTAGAAIEVLKDQTGPISGDDVESLVVNATKDFDAQAAGNEFADLNQFATENWDRFSPDAKAKFRVYQQAAQAAQADGRTGMSLPEWNGMVEGMKGAGYADATAGAAIEVLEGTPGTISGEDMEQAIVSATKDLDAQAAGNEYADLKEFATANWDRLSPDAREKFRTYEGYAQAAQAQGLTGIPAGSYHKMLGELSRAGYADETSAAAIETLKDQPGTISGDDMEKALIDATSDLDAQAAGNEWDDLLGFASQNWDRMSPDARQKFRVYRHEVMQAKAQGLTGIPAGDYAQMIKDMKSVEYADEGAAAAIEALKTRGGPFTGDDLQDLIIQGTQDLDGQAAGAEFDDIARFARGSWDQLSPSAKADFRIYEQYANAAQAQGLTGIPQGDWNNMVNEMKVCGYFDASAGLAIEGLNDIEGPISGEAFTNAVLQGTNDLDGQAAGDEFADFFMFAANNWDRMTPEAQEAYDVYQNTAVDWFMQGSSGIPEGDYNAMIEQMRRACLPGLVHQPIRR